MTITNFTLIILRVVHSYGKNIVILKTFFVKINFLTFCTPIWDFQKNSFEFVYKNVNPVSNQLNKYNQFIIVSNKMRVFFTERNKHSIRCFHIYVAFPDTIRKQQLIIQSYKCAGILTLISGESVTHFIDKTKQSEYLFVFFGWIKKAFQWGNGLFKMNCSKDNVFFGFVHK